MKRLGNLFRKLLFSLFFLITTMSDKPTYCYEYTPSKKGQSAIYISKMTNGSKLNCSHYPGVDTLYDAFNRGKSISPDSPCYGYRPVENGVAGHYTWLTYNEVAEKAKDFGAGLFHRELVPEQDGLRLVGIYSKNCLEWNLTEQACNAYTMVVCPIYDTLGADTVEFILQQTEMRVCVCGPNEVLKVLTLFPRISKLTTIVQIGEVSEKTQQVARECNVTVVSFNDIIKEGHEHPVPVMPPSADDVCTICYTSGTTGQPKGALITHRNIVAAVGGVIDCGLIPMETDRYLSYLPLAHVLERCLQMAMLVAGARIGFYQGDTRKIVDDMKELRPTVFCSVPRLLNRVHDAIINSIKKKGYLVSYLFDWGMSWKKWSVEHKQPKNYWLFDKLLFDNILYNAGLDQVRATISGSAPLSDEVKSFLRCIINGFVVEGYGATETAGPTTIEFADDPSVGTVGGPVTSALLKVADVPEMGYFATDREHNGQPCLARGELRLKGYNITKGYYKNPTLTKAAFDEEGFFMTGDIAVILPNYAVKIVDRKKNFFKLSQGEYVAAEKLEIMYGSSPFVSQIFVHGDSLQSYLVAFVVPEKGYTMNWAKSVPALKGKEFADVCQSDELREVLVKEFARIFAENKLKGFERIVKFSVETDPWTVENGLMTPTFKLLRKNIKTKFEDKINKMYASN